MSLYIFYDGDCPFCSRYVQLLRLRESAGPVTLHDLRQAPEARARFTDLNLDPDTGMVVETGGQLYHGDDAMQILSLLSTPSGVMNRASATIFRHKPLARGLYPILRAGRNATLLLMGREAMRSPDAGESALFALFSRFLGLFAILHVFIYVFRYAPLTYQLTTLPLLLLGLGLIFTPGSRRVFVATVMVFALDGWLQAPLYSNHTILKNFLMLALVFAGAWHWLRGNTWERFFSDIRPVGRVLLMIMYTFGIFHKINTDFLDPSVSCAVALWREMPPPLAWIDMPAMHYAAIYGTFAAEAAIMLMLIVPRWRHYGIGAGIGFHTLLALSGYAMYPVFSTLTITLHILFLSPGAALRITQSLLYDRLERRINSLPGLAFIMTVLVLIPFAALLREFTLVAFLWLLLVAWPLGAIVLYGRPQDADEEHGWFFWSRLPGLNLVGVVFFLSCAAPYFGLKTAQAMNMFANIRLEGGVSNHLVLPAPPGPFGYLEYLVVIEEAEGSVFLERLAEKQDRALVYYHLLSLMEETPDAVVTFERDGARIGPVSGAELLAADGDMLHPEWMRKFFHFRSVQLDRPTPCD